MSYFLWAIPAAAFVMALIRLARLFRWSRSKKLIRAEALKAQLSIVASTEAPAPVSPERKLPGLPGPTSRTKGSSVAADLDRGSRSRESFKRLCVKFRIREIALLPSTRRACGSVEPNLQILVEFEHQARVDYPTFFKLRQELFEALGRRVDLVCRNSADLEGQRDVFAQAQVLYAA